MISKNDKNITILESHAAPERLWLSLQRRIPAAKYTRVINTKRISLAAREDKITPLNKKKTARQQMLIAKYRSELSKPLKQKRDFINCTY
ncbi:hypothetical protein RGQ13_14825 [Thalassotalea psychrophila]|uniref:Uncharacterized protein n=1 Tax=Thalassotalea psychrophila TaxID=3065647 RepID=A0ABY9TUM5_9GAMM|nr:hypothetical protein RGQ13_14825 [Colwelliaceae bacterium SQ149]